LKYRADEMEMGEISKAQVLSTSKDEMVLEKEDYSKSGKGIS